mgnify:CR=1 FL=1|tara:strand:+ start:2008 stop:2544 length:537 start_codon:yes stop_codon:yes gene_type:complete
MTKAQILNFHSEPVKSRFYFNTNLRRWFSRNEGLWRSRRQYFFGNEDALLVDMFLKIEKMADNRNEDYKFRFSWWSEKEFELFIQKPQYSREGIIDISLQGHQIYRTKGFSSDTSFFSSIKHVDEHELIFESSYDDWYIQENTRLIDQDRYRSRNIYSWNKDKLEIVENHHEIRLEAS